MLYSLLVPLADHLGILNVVRYITFRTAAATLTALFISFIVGPWLIRRLAAHCTASGLEWVGLVAEPGTAAFYARLGFRPLDGYVPMRLPPPGAT